MSFSIRSLSPARMLAAAAERFYPGELDIDANLKKLDVARILIGIFAFVRMLQIARANIVLVDSPSHNALATATVVAALMLTLGLFTPLAAIGLAILMRHADNVYQTGTLGTSVLIHCLLIFALLRAGRHYSLDRAIFANTRIGQFVYARPSQIEMKSAFAFALIIYGTISFAALWFHIKDPYWTSGLTVKAMFTSTYLCKHPDLFRELDRNAPAMLGLLSIGAGIAQSIFQFLMIPLMFFVPGRFFVRWHGLGFFLASLLFLNLSFLPHYELVLWWIILWPILQSSAPVAADEAAEKPCLPVGAYAFYSVYSILVLLFLCTIHWTSLKNYGRSMIAGESSARYIARAAGLEVPIVFDTIDLEMGNRWALLYRKTPSDPDWVLTPLTTIDGRKSNYLGRDVFWAGNHNTDLLYFGTTLSFRRRMIGLTGPQLNKFIDEGLGRPAIERQIRYDYRFLKLSGVVRYRMVVMDTGASNVSLFHYDEERLRGREILSREYVFDGRALTYSDTAMPNPVAP